MLILLTYQCHENCSHCMHSCSQTDSVMMNVKTFNKVIEFIQEHGFQGMVVQVSGGEPMLHPDCIKYLERLVQLPIIVVLESNGSFYTNRNLYSKIHSLLTQYWNLVLQIRTDRRYYPNYKNIVNNMLLKSLPTTQVLEGGITLFPLGRAVDNHPNEINIVQNPMCSALRANFNLGNLHSMGDAIRTMQMKAKKFCKPMISPEGKVFLGESRFCQSIGTIFDSEETLLNAARTFSCNNCGLEENFKMAVEVACSHK